MSEANPIVLVEELRKVLGRYIATTLPISRRYPRLAQRFRQELQQQKLVDGPTWKPCRISKRAPA
jgi:hypothetical protein